MRVAILNIITLLSAVFITLIYIGPRTHRADVSAYVNDQHDRIRLGDHAEGVIIVIPTGERILLINPGYGSGCAVLLPPLPAPVVEQGPRSATGH